MKQQYKNANLLFPPDPVRFVSKITHLKATSPTEKRIHPQVCNVVKFHKNKQFIPVVEFSNPESRR